MRQARARGIVHSWQRCGDGHICLDASPWGTTRFIWLPDSRSIALSFRFGNENDYPGQLGDEAVLGWVARQRPLGSRDDSGIEWDHRYQGFGDGRILVHRSAWGPYRLVWLPHLPEEGDPVIKYGDESDFADVAGRSIPDVLGWATAQPWGQQTTRRPFEAARLRVAGPFATVEETHD